MDGSGGVREGLMSMMAIGVRAEFERTTKMECENNSKIDHFWVHSQVTLKSILEK